ncbi:MAG: VWA domain-containing protein [Myxococcales bacterium]|nr:VWA domain-containing protein [Myxococcales bacterium]
MSLHTFPRRVLFATFAAGLGALVAGPSFANPPGTVDHALQPVAATARPAAAIARRPLIQVAVLLDTSNSMDGLIAQAKTELWRIVNEIAAYKKGGQDPEVQVALIEYGKQSIPAAEGHMRVVVPFTTELDRVSEALFALHTDGGDEYCGQAIDMAVEALQWSREPGDFRTIFIAGNEPFTQGRVDFRFSIGKAHQADIAVNTIHCGTRDEGIRGAWQNGAELGHGAFMAILQNERQVMVATPYDAEISRLGEKMNETYVGYGQRGVAAKARQVAQDDNAEAAGGGASVERSLTKSKAAVYSNDDWDLVDARNKGKADVKTMAPAALPAEMQAMSAPEREAFVEKKSKQRTELQSKLSTLDAKRKKFIADAVKGGADKDKNTFDAAMRTTLKVQLEARSFGE